MGTRATGDSGEALARQFLEARGLTVRAANVRSPFGEIDLVLDDPRTRELVFVEVRTRSGGGFGTPEESVTRAKLFRLRRLVAWYCQRVRWKGSVRLDVVGVQFCPGAAPTITHTPAVG